MFDKVFSIASALILSSCASHSNMDIPRELSEIIKAPASFDPSSKFGKWLIEKKNEPRFWAIIGQPYDPKLRLRSSKKPYRLLRKIDSNILLTPFLTWSWMAEDGAWEQHPIQIIVGLQTKQNMLKDLSGSPRPFFKGLVPAHDRVIFFEWRKSETQEKFFTNYPSKSDGPKQVSYVVRWGKNNLNQWHSEAIDLISITKKAWPSLKKRATKIVFLGVSVQKSEEIEIGYIKKLHLSR